MIFSNRLMLNVLYTEWFKSHLVCRQLPTDFSISIQLYKFVEKTSKASVLDMSRQRALEQCW